jgi:LmbE family N-acetylglucosaminyl deacetylase
MLDLIPDTSVARGLDVLCIGAHCDDVEIGCGATLCTFATAGRLRKVDWVILAGSAERRAETEHAMKMLVPDEVRGGLLFGNFRDGATPAEYLSVKEFFEGIKDWSSPDILFTHEREDRHQDHRIVNEMTWNTFRNNLILEYEIPKWDGGLKQPNLYVPVAQADVDRKIETVLACYVSQSERDWFTRSTFEALLRLRGIESRSPSGWAEAFHARKIGLRP